MLMTARPGRPRKDEIIHERTCDTLPDIACCKPYSHQQAPKRELCQKQIVQNKDTGIVADKWTVKDSFCSAPSVTVLTDANVLL